MKNKILFAIALTSLLLTGCGTAKEKNSDDQYAIFKLAQEAGFEGTYEEWLASIKGEKGDTGEPGASFLSGEGIPSKDLGKDGDSYLDITNNDFYKKENGKWVKTGNLSTNNGTSDPYLDGYGFFYVPALDESDAITSYRHYVNRINYSIPNQFNYKFVSCSSSSPNVVFEKSGYNFVSFYSDFAGEYEITLSFDYKDIHKSLTFPFIVTEEEVFFEICSDLEYINSNKFFVGDTIDEYIIQLYKKIIFPNGDIEKVGISFNTALKFKIIETGEEFELSSLSELGYTFKNPGTYTFVVSELGKDYLPFTFSIQVYALSSEIGYVNFNQMWYEFHVGDYFMDCYNLEFIFYPDSEFGNLYSRKLEYGFDYTTNFDENYCFTKAGEYEVIYSFLTFEYERQTQLIYVYD